jgi:hypothetical protein
MRVGKGVPANRPDLSAYVVAESCDGGRGTVRLVRITLKIVTQNDGVIGQGP